MWLLISIVYTGTTWVQAIVWFIDSVDQDVQQHAILADAFLFIEWPGTLEDIAKRPSPRLFKTHLAYDLLPADVHNVGAKVCINLKLLTEISRL